MRRSFTIAGLLLSLMAGLVLMGQTSARAAAPGAFHVEKPKKCSVGAYKHARCDVVPKKGKFDWEVGGAPTFLHGKGNAATAGTQVITQRVSMPGSKAGDLAFKVYANGPFPKLYLSGPQKYLYKYDPKTNTWKMVNAVNGPGIYRASNH